MEAPLHTRGRVDRELTGETISTVGYAVTPTARLQGQWGANASDNHHFGYAWLRLKPVKITVQDADGRTEEIELTDVNAQAATAMGAIALVTAAVCLGILLLRRLFH